MTPNDASKDGKSRAIVLRSTIGGFAWKLIIVGAGVGAYLGLSAMEQQKNSYDQAKGARIVIVEQLRNSYQTSANGQTPNPMPTPTRDTVELTVSEVKNMFPGTPVSDLKKDMDGYVDRVKYQPFKDGVEAMDRLTEEILKDKASEERAGQQQRDILDKNFATTRTNLFTQNNERCPKVENDSKEQNIRAAHVQRKRTDPAVLDCNELEARIARAELDYKAQRKRLADESQQIDERAEARVKSVYENLRKPLFGKIEERQRELKNRSFAYIFPATVLDDENGGYVIYRVLWLAATFVLVFGFLFVILISLRSLPVFADGTEALTEQAKSFLARRGVAATPELAKAVLITTAGLGIATVVAVGSGINMAAPGINTRLGDVYERTGKFSVTVKQATPKQPGPEPTPNITFTAPITYPSPMTIYSTVNIPSSEKSRIDSLDAKLTNLQSGVDQTNNSVSMKADAGAVEGLDRRIGGLESSQGYFSNRIDAVKSGVTQLQGQAEMLKQDFTNRMNEVASTADAIRNDNVTRFQPPAGRSFLTRTRQFLNLAQEHYAVTNQSYNALKSLMCHELITTGVDGQPKRDLNCADANFLQILTELQKLIGREPMTEDQLVGFLGATRLKPWKTIVLKYTRIPY
jgi:hypothetical protein